MGSLCSSVPRDVKKQSVPRELQSRQGMEKKRIFTPLVVLLELEK